MCRLDSSPTLFVFSSLLEVPALCLHKSIAPTLHILDGLAGVILGDGQSCALQAGLALDTGLPFRRGPRAVPPTQERVPDLGPSRVAHGRQEGAGQLANYN